MTIKVMEKYPYFENTFEQAFIGIPADVVGLSDPFYGLLSEAKLSLPEVFKIKKKITTVFYMQGSGEFGKGETFRKWLTGEGSCVFFAPNSHQGNGRPVYQTPAPKAAYEKVHAYRQAEIQYALSRIAELPFVDTSRLFLMGYSEGGLAAARYAGDEFKARIVLSWTCEPGYYTDHPELGRGSEKRPFLNIIGRDDAYFGKNSLFNKQYANEGHCAAALSDYKYAKVVLLPNTGHDLMENPFTKPEILGFIQMFKDFTLE